MRSKGTILVLSLGLVTLLAAGGYALAHCGSCGTGKAVSPPAVTAGEAAPKACGAGCTKPCCADKAKAGKAKTCGANCTKPCCAGKGKAACAASAIAQVDAIKKAIEADKKEESLKLLAALREKMVACQAGKGKCCQPAAAAKPAAQPAVANTKCPIMGNPVDPKNVPANLYRIHKGKGVGFCCGGCMAPWDKLTDEQKEAKLQAVK